ncbi:hypothetical protein Tco_0800263 [Tanacetum coccineum]|uniref:Uncharacterized protein n=1 Tax=Tanacetum coccineum TaxID=301880 RepID=A0ABQ4ZWD6_9ASTR
MVTDLEDPKTHNVGGVWSGEYMDHGFTKSMSELDRCYTMLQELHSVIVGGALIHKNREGNKHEGQRIHPTIVVDRENTTRCFGSWIDSWEYGRRIKKYEGFRVDVKRKSIEDKVHREKVFEVDEALNIENTRESCRILVICNTKEQYRNVERERSWEDGSSKRKQQRKKD